MTKVKIVHLVQYDCGNTYSRTRIIGFCEKDIALYEAFLDAYQSAYIMKQLMVQSWTVTY